MELLHGFRPTPLLFQGLKFSMLFIEDGLFRIEHQTIGRTHKSTSMQNVCDSVASYQSASDGRKPTILGTFKNLFPMPC
jgi:hypothetical protein